MQGGSSERRCRTSLPETATLPEPFSSGRVSCTGRFDDASQRWGEGKRVEKRTVTAAVSREELPQVAERHLAQVALHER